MTGVVRDKAKGRTAYTNVFLLDPASGLHESGALLTQDGVIAAFGPGLFNDGVPEGIRILDGGGACLCPGLVDMRVQLREPGFEHQETIVTAGQSAAVGGVTSMVCLPNTDPVIDDVAGVEFIARRARKAGLAKVFVYAALTKQLKGEEITEFGLLHDAGAKGFTDGALTLANARVMRQALSYATFCDSLIIQHPEVPELAGGVMNAGELATRLGLSGVSPMVEVIQAERDVRLAEMTGGRLHLAHISCAETVAVIRRAKARKIRVSCDTAPFYFALNENAVGDYRTFAKLNPPLRSEADREAIVEGLKDGTIDAVASDHCPQDQDSKRLPFAAAAFGAVGLETLLPITLELHHNGHMTLLDAIDLVTRKPADLLGLNAGRLKIGAPADLALFVAGAPGKVNPDTFHSKSKNSPFDGRLIQGRVVCTVIDGRRIYADQNRFPDMAEITGPRPFFNAEGSDGL